MSSISTATVVQRYRRLWVLAVGQLIVGIGLGLIWLAWSPHSVAYNLDLGSGHGTIIPAGEGESLIAADGRFAVLTGIAGLVFGLAAWQLRDLRGRFALVAIVTSSLVASVLAKFTGQLLSGGHKTAAINTAFRPQLTLHATSALFLQALLAGLIYTMFVGLSGDPHLGRPEPDPAVATEVPAALQAPPDPSWSAPNQTNPSWPAPTPPNQGPEAH